MTPAPCPFCGAVLVRSRNGWAHPARKALPQPQQARCPLVGHFFGDKYLEWSGWREEPTFWHYEVVDGLPVFNNQGRGEPATLEFVNDCFGYIAQISR